MTTPRPSETAETSLAQDLLHAAHYYLGGRRGLFALAGLAAVATLAFNWSWLAAAGIAPILIGALPCLAMCALGLCMNRARARARSPGTNAREASGNHDAARAATRTVEPNAPDASPAG